MFFFFLLVLCPPNFSLFFFNNLLPSEFYTVSLHFALFLCVRACVCACVCVCVWVWVGVCVGVGGCVVGGRDLEGSVLVGSKEDTSRMRS